MSSEDDTIVVTVARVAPSWIRWAGYAIVLGLGVSYVIAPGMWIVYTLCTIGFGLVYFGTECYDQFIWYYNSQQLKHLEHVLSLDDPIEQGKGTFQDNDGLKNREEHKDEQDK